MLYLRCAFLIALLPAAFGSVILGPPELPSDLPAGDIFDGIVFTALDDSFLLGFTFTNLGGIDEIELLPLIGNIVFGMRSVELDAGSPFFNVSWRLQAGFTYELIAEAPGNGTFSDSPPSYPDADSDISVTSSVVNQTSFTTSEWVNFTNLTTAALPEPGAAAQLAAGIAIMVLAGKLKQFTSRRKLSD